MRLARASQLDTLVSEYERAELTYAEAGATRGALPGGYHHTRFRRRIGDGEASFRRAAEIVLGWDMQRGAGMKVAVDGPATEGRTVVMQLGRPIGLAIACRVVYVTDEPKRQGFGYGTLPGHPECGEEAFGVELDDNDQVWLEITAFTRPGSTLIAAVGPLNRLAQNLALRAYARSIRRQILR